MPAEGWIVEIGLRSHPKAIEPKFATDDGCSLEIHAGRPLRRDQLDEGTAMFGHDNALTARRSGGSFGEASLGLAYREFHGGSPIAPTPQVGWHDSLTRSQFVVAM